MELGDLLARLLHDPEPFQSERGEEHVMVPEGFCLESLGMVEPRNIEASRHFGSLESFISYYNRFCVNGSSIYVSRTNVVAILDHHCENIGPNLEEHTIHYPMEPSDEWEAWEQVDGKLLKQAEFAQFLEDRVADIIEPAGADVLELAMDMQSNTSVEFSSKVSIHDGRVQLVYREVENASAGPDRTMQVPREITLKIPVYQRGEHHYASCKLLWRSAGGQLMMGVRIQNKARLMQAAMDAIVEQLREGTKGGPVYLGTPT